MKNQFMATENDFIYIFRFGEQLVLLALVVNFQGGDTLFSYIRPNFFVSSSTISVFKVCTKMSFKEFFMIKSS
jgi:hypothetical protein